MYNLEHIAQVAVAFMCGYWLFYVAAPRVISKAKQYFKLLEDVAGN